ncbi:DUF1868 domain-containing protein [Xanthomonas citri pv. fuscans CFBP 6996]|uniref:DUF1868 domain-containing protein n=1 Tax=Xanthomonas citri TaxID=346 RepID=UPI000C19B9A5|nr:DUF1868 domain-containing protein [Xanthomonas citri]ATS49882.1 DUF1868 domain-containing protein [Xanthomonas citri pv. phaseoli var. fuscans]ATS55615.1 DUF1868 domain-containing protein [Xanthomonas citri pv. phaseoli var. fuscans]ATS60370.1 DUF1868 domain-containing protein [Xanthomonas citri pv. phaseoli var. fuscans]PTY30570.1 DUF1868 domain-containing protein [Xanthomonas citri pv. fuscans CFBP 6996]QWN14506.1 DUF1868 domain-containing protein [Xanthomonas citri]
MSSFLDTRISRRHLMAATGASLLATGLTTRAMTPPPSDVGRKFLRSRRPMPFAGNTFVGHLEQQGDGYDSFDRVLNIYREFPEQRFAHKFAVLPPSSYHVTLLGGVNEIDRARGPWPSDLPRDHALADINAAYLARLKERAAPPLGACRFLVNPTAARTGNNDNLLIPLKPADTQTAQRLEAARQALMQLTRLQRPDYTNFQFHISLAYLCDTLDAAEQTAYRTAVRGWLTQLAAAGPITVPRFHFCTFDDMDAFRTVLEV